MSIIAKFSDAIVDILHRDGLDRAAFARAKRTLYADFIYGFDSTEGIASSLMTTAMDGVGLFDLPKLDESITYEEVSALYSAVFRSAQYTLSTVTPSEGNPLL